VFSPRRSTPCPWQGIEPGGLIWKKAIHCVVELGNNLLLPALPALGLALFQISDKAKKH